MLIVNFDGHLDPSETGESTKSPWLRVVEGTASGKNRAFYTLPGFARIKSPSNSTIDLYDLTKNRGL